LNKYDSLFIFHEQLTDEALESVVTRLQGEVEKLGGKVGAVDRLGRRQFARRLQKKSHGHYVRMVFSLDPAQAAALNARFKLSDELFRYQVVSAHVPSARSVAAKRKAAERAKAAGGG
jgi:ribosomal protein S6